MDKILALIQPKSQLVSVGNTAFFKGLKRQYRKTRTHQFGTYPQLASVPIRKPAQYKTIINIGKICPAIDGNAAIEDQTRKPSISTGNRQSERNRTSGDWQGPFRRPLPAVYEYSYSPPLCLLGCKPIDSEASADDQVAQPIIRFKFTFC